MFFAGLVFLSAVSISITAAYFSVIGLATMFPGSKEAIIIMGGVLEVGKLIASVWLHHNWNNSFKFLKRYLLFSVVVLSLITSMGIFGFLSRSHVEHHASIEKEQAIVAQIEQKIDSQKKYITRKEDQLSSYEDQTTFSQTNASDNVATLQSRIDSLKQEKEESILKQQEIISNKNQRLSILDTELDKSKSGLFGGATKYDKTLALQSEERSLIATSKQQAENNIQNISDTFDQQIQDTRNKIDSLLSIGTSEKQESPKDKILQEIEGAHNKINELEAEKFTYGAKLRNLEVEIGPILYIANLLNEWFGFSFDISQAIRIVIITLIFVFDPLAILLLIASTMTYSQHKKAKIPPDVRAIRNKLLDELEDYLSEGGIADHFIEKAKK
jgi:hypothetical protein